MHTFRVRTWGELACFTRPEMKVERLSYACMTYSAARNILQAIYWKPEIRWHVRRIAILAPIRFISFKRNEVRGAPAEPFFADAMGREFETTGRDQRNTIALRDVAYRIEADMEILNGAPEKHREMMQRRLESGQCFMRPALGCREFAAYFEPADSDEPAIDDSRDLGLMFYDWDYHDPAPPNRQPRWEPRETPTPMFVPARLNHGILDFTSLPIYRLQAQTTSGGRA